ncbi:transposase [Dysgonomonas sp. PFB1-18]|uniref:transposase n=1 Tax=unclassified Dysgonomonas TaxID=2630389 RepID=UPI0024750E19|nr:MULTISPECIES: transposase [unclassified Dysgonomonas]MDH6309498.1 transposase [Dysgonomonas sp. PF1-14]MDH6339174.1 transposase [Dysgonomonas sp. PF1-16]MDH6380539.1 transposase [Dysgonomonas sp. PFB1-18]MDH6398035.1 transposase [Dysgonomonas sp. PF1-23]
MNKIYPTDITDTQWQYMKKVLLFEERKRKHDLKEIWNALFYLVKTGCQWRMLPKKLSLVSTKNRTNICI